MAERVLVVDDEPDVAKLLVFNLRQAGFDAESVGSGGEALLSVARSEPTVVVLDLMLPDLGGLEVCRRLRADEQARGVGVLMLTALGDDDSRIEGLESGADDYVVKPFNVDEVVLRVKALCRRIGERRAATTSGAPGRTLKAGTLELDPVTHRVQSAGVALDLRPLEFKLLATLMAEPGRVFSREDLMSRVWEIDHPASPRTVDVHIRRLRRNLGDSAEVVETVPGFGYRCRD